MANICSGENSKKYFHVKRKALAFSVAAVAAGLALGSGTAIAQDEEIEQITVTGSRIRTTSGFETSTPVTTMSLPELHDFAPGNTISEQLDALPQFFNTSSPQRGDSPIFSGGASALNLRSLGSNRTLVLLDGRRVVPTDKRGLVNVDLLPTGLMRSVDVVTGGASAAYGADAVSGVVNFVLDREFEGLKTNIGGGALEGGEGRQWEFDVAGGRSFFDDRLHVIGSASSREIGQIQEGDRSDVDNFNRIGWVTNPAWVANPSQRGTRANPGTPQRLTLPNVVSTLTSPTGLIRAPGTPLDLMQFTQDGRDITRFVLGDVVAMPGTAGSTSSMAGGPEASRAFQTFDTTPDGAEAITRSLFLGLKFDVSDRLALTLDGRTGRLESNDVSTRGFFELESPWNMSLAVDNAFLPETVRQAMRANNLTQIRVDKLGSFQNGLVGNGIEVGSGETGRSVFTQWEYALGFEYQIPGVEWTVEGRWQQAESKRNAQVLDHPRVDRLFLAMDAVRDPSTGAIVCRVQTVNPTVEQLKASVAGRISSVPVSPFINLSDAEQSTTTGGVSAGAGNTKPLESPIGLDNTIRDCVPFNVMGSGNITREALDYISDEKISEGFVDQDFAELLVSGDLFDLPAGPVSFAAGLTWRDQQFIDGARTQVGTGVNGLPVTVDELGPPLNAPALGIRGIPPGFTGGSPNLHLFSTIPNVAGQTDVWEWFAEVQVPVLESTWGQSMGFEQRLDMNAAYRESDYDRSGTSESWKIGGDLRFHRDWRLRYTRSQDVREPTFSELFDSQGGGGTVNDPRFNNASFQITSVSGGNPGLQPEIADTETAGIVWQPTFATWIDGLQISVDWYDVEIEGQIATLGLQRILDECELRKVAPLCAQITRDPVTGTIGRIFNTFLNVAGGTVSGTDLEVGYRLEPNFFASQSESFSVRWLTGYVEEETSTPLGGSATDDSGTQGTPDLTSVLTTTYGVGPYSFQLQGRYIDSTALNGTWMEGVDVDDNSIASMTWWNARFGYSGELSNGANWNVNLNVQNVFDQDPPIVPGFSTRGGTQAFGNRFDVFGRRYNLSASLTF